MTQDAPSPPAAGWSHFAHGADIGVAGWGPSPAIAFEQAALALAGAVTDAPVAGRERVSVRCAAPALDLLLVEWLNAVIYEMAVRRMIFARFAVRISGTTLSADILGERVDVARHQPVVEPKGATYTALRVTQDEYGVWHAECVIDV